MLASGRPINRTHDDNCIAIWWTPWWTLWVRYLPSGLVSNTKTDRLQLKCDGPRWRPGGEVKGKVANGVGSQYSSHYLGTWCIQLPLMRTPRLPVVDWTVAPADLKKKSGFCACAITFQLASTSCASVSRTKGCLQLFNLKRITNWYKLCGVHTVAVLFNKATILQNTVHVCRTHFIPAEHNS